jgi:AraC-like DNA-binding protein
MSVIKPEIEIIDRSDQSLVYLEHGWPTKLCRWHAHEEYELHLILETRGKAFVGDYIGEFGPGCLYLTGPNLPHNWVTDERYKNPVKVRDMMVQFTHTCMSQLMAGFPEFSEINALLELSQSGVEFKNVDRNYLIKTLAELRDLRGPARILKFLSLMSVLAAHPHKSVLSVVKLQQPETGRRHHKIAEVIDLIVKNCAEDVSVGKAASMAGMSEASFSRNFQTITGNRFVEFVNRVRIGQACVMLFETEEQISSICYDVGFQNLANFNRHFLKMKAMTPSEYRQSARANLTLSTQIPEGSPQ